MEHKPLRSDAESPPLSPEIKKSSITPSKIVNKRTIVIAAIVILVLVILVIVLGALLGVERAKRKGKFKFNILKTTAANPKHSVQSRLWC